MVNCLETLRGILKAIVLCLQTPVFLSLLFSYEVSIPLGQLSSLTVSPPLMS